MKPLSPFFFLIALLFSCQNEESPRKESALPSGPAAMQAGFSFWQNQCFSCHQPNPDVANPVAPSLAAIKKAYAGSATTYPAFAQHLNTFLQNPSPSTSRMPAAIEQYGVMPKFSLSEEQVYAIAHYLYQTPVEAPQWFEEQFEEEKKKYTPSEADLPPLELGKKWAMQTKSVLGKNLLHAIKTEGTEEAVAFCHTRAYPLTDSMSTVLNARIKRVSDRNRNPENAANERQLAYIQEAKAQLAVGESIKPQIYESAGQVECYYPILTNKMCLSCHGNPEEMDPGTLKKIQTLYPEDKATGYGENELRGIWVVEFER